MNLSEAIRLMDLALNGNTHRGHTSLVGVFPQKILLEETVNKSKLIKKFKTLTRVMSNRGDIKINLSGSKCFTDFQSITLPIGNFEDQDYLELLEGAIDHEVGHLQWTDKHWTRKSHEQGEFFNGIRNAIEDIRMERMVCNEWPGAIFNLTRLVTQAIKRGWFCEPTAEASPSLLVHAVVLYYGRFKYNQHSQLSNFSEKSIELFAEKLGKDTTNKVIALLDSIPQLKSNKDSYFLTEKIVSLLKDLKDSDDNQSGDSDDNQSGDSDDNQSGDSDDNQSGDSDDNQSGDSDDNQSGDSDDNQSGDSQSIQKFIDDCINADESQMIPDLHEQVNKELEKISEQEYVNSNDEVLMDFNAPNIENHDNNLNGNVDVVLAKKIANSANRELQKVVYGLKRHCVNFSKSGSIIDANRLSGVKAGNFNVFKSERITKAPTMAVSVLVDRSSSMTSSEMRAANTSALSLNIALDKLKGVASECLYFSSGNLNLAKSFKQSAKSVSNNFGVKEYGYTYTGLSLYAAVRRLVLRDEQKKLVIIITDGDASDPKFLEKSLEMAETLDIQVLCIGIATGHLTGFENQELISINDASELPNVLKNAIKGKLIT